MLADNDMDLRTNRLTIWHTAWLLDEGHRAGAESSIAKVVCSEAIYRVADRCVQVLGGQGITNDTLVERIFREVRGFRIYDGPSKVHRWSLAQKLVKRAQTFKRRRRLGVRATGHAQSRAIGWSVHWTDRPAG